MVFGIKVNSLRISGDFIFLNFPASVSITYNVNNFLSSFIKAIVFPLHKKQLIYSNKIEKT